jgi:septal ring factor EnvC (AmiA/AmiB activator)
LSELLYPTNNCLANSTVRKTKMFIDLLPPFFLPLLCELKQRKHKAESSNLQSQITKLASQLKDTTGALDTSQNQLHKLETSLSSAHEEITRLRASLQHAEAVQEANGEREEMEARFELELRLGKQKAGLQLAKQQLLVVELERRCFKLESRLEQVSAENESHVVRSLLSHQIDESWRWLISLMRSLDGSSVH